MIAMTYRVTELIGMELGGHRCKTPDERGVKTQRLHSIPDPDHFDVGTPMTVPLCETVTEAAAPLLAVIGVDESHISVAGHFMAQKPIAVDNAGERTDRVGAS